MTELSPRAQAVFWAFNSKFNWISDGVPGPCLSALAAALRALDAELGHNVLTVRAVDCAQIQMLANELDDAEVSQ